MIATRITTAVISQPNRVKHGLVSIMPSDRNAMLVTTNSCDQIYRFCALASYMRSFHLKSPNGAILIII